MPNTREKLIEIEQAAVWFEKRAKDTPMPGARKMFEIGAEVLREKVNGVTVQEWISVKDRLPEDDSDVLAYLRIGQECRIYPANYAKGMWFDCIFNTPATENTTHWMPLPQPPKGE